MTLALGRRRGEVHAWTFKSLKHKTGWKEVTVAPSSVFLSKNQLASDGPNVVQPVVIRHSNDKTKDLREEKHLLFIRKMGFQGTSKNLPYHLG